MDYNAILSKSKLPVRVNSFPPFVRMDRDASCTSAADKRRVTQTDKVLGVE
jgi:hypothetical protein